MTRLFLGERLDLENLKGSLSQIHLCISKFNAVLSSNLGLSRLDDENDDPESAEAIGQE